MAKGRFSEIYDGLPPWGKVIFLVGVIGLPTALGIAIYKGVKKRQDNQKNQQSQDQLESAAQSSLDAFASRGIYPTYTKEQYKGWANALVTCFSGWLRSGSDCYMMIFGKMNNDADVYRLIQEYGIRTVSSGKFDPAPDYKGDLAGIIHDQLSSGELDDLNALLTSKNISYSF